MEWLELLDHIESSVAELAALIKSIRETGPFRFSRSEDDSLDTELRGVLETVRRFKNASFSDVQASYLIGAATSLERAASIRWGGTNSNGAQVVDIASSILVAARMFAHRERPSRNLPRLPAFVPSQSISPFKYGVIDNRLEVLDYVNQPAHVDADITEAARSSLLRQSDLIIDRLMNSNHSFLTEFYEELRQNLRQNGNIIQLGIAAQMCRKVTTAADKDKELTSVFATMLFAHLDTISDYLAQFPDWRRFNANAVETKMDNESFELLIASTRKLADAMSGHLSYVAPEVPASLNKVADWAGAGGSRPNGPIILALTRSISNLLSVVVREIARMPGEVVGEGRKALARIILSAFTSAAVFGGLYSLGLIPEGGWIATALDYLKAVAGEARSFF